MDNIKYYKVSEDYADYLLPHAPHLFRKNEDNKIAKST